MLDMIVNNQGDFSMPHSHLSLIHYQPGHAAIKNMVQKAVHAYKKHDPNRQFFIYKPVGTSDGVAYCFIAHGKFGLLKKELGDNEAKSLMNSAKDGVKSSKNFKVKTTRHSKNFSLGAPYLAVVKVTFDPSQANHIRDVAKKIESHPGINKRHTVFTLDGVKNTFYIAFGVDNIEILDKKGGIMSYVEDPAVKTLYNEFKKSVTGMKLIKLRLLPQFSNC